MKRLLILCILSLFLVSCSNAVLATSNISTTSVVTIKSTPLITSTTTTSLGGIPITSNITTTAATAIVIPAQASVLYIILNPQLPNTLSKGSVLQMTAIAQFSDGTRMDITNQATWASSNIQVAIVSKTGQVKGIGAGGANISATLDGTPSNPPITVYVK